MASEQAPTAKEAEAAEADAFHTTCSQAINYLLTRNTWDDPEVIQRVITIKKSLITLSPFGRTTHTADTKPQLSQELAKLLEIWRTHLIDLQIRRFPRALSSSDRTGIQNLLGLEFDFTGWTIPNTDNITDDEEKYNDLVVYLYQSAFSMLLFSALRMWLLGQTPDDVNVARAHNFSSTMTALFYRKLSQAEYDNERTNMIKSGDFDKGAQEDYENETIQDRILLRTEVNVDFINIVCGSAEREQAMIDLIEDLFYTFFDYDTSEPWKGDPDDACMTDGDLNALKEKAIIHIDTTDNLLQQLVTTAVLSTSPSYFLIADRLQFTRRFLRKSPGAELNMTHAIQQYVEGDIRQEINQHEVFWRRCGEEFRRLRSVSEAAMAARRARNVGSS
ncbi:hypothetical protein BT63DRAFT_310924 [Microthyrium microscopicum]|uniref:Uncharacterized protein n=1 Tax=Microthyrium microscopicum TaxID=703497 RepID=A0A6A6U6E8_9PEZI|nr:hypothetical protein BT63DRAFT_310924 [Microthyrium microscopicum]